MGSATLKSMSLWLIMNPERFIKKSIQDDSLAVFEDEKAADKQVKKVSEANSEDCTVEEFSLCNKHKLSKHLEIHSEMYEIFDSMIEQFEYDGCTEYEFKLLASAKNILAKARGEL